MQLRTTPAYPYARQAAPPSDVLQAHLQHVRAAVLLAGDVRPTVLRKATGRSCLELPMTGADKLFDHWRWQLVRLADHAGLRRLAVRLMVDQAAPLVNAVARQGPADISIESDPADLRGTGGLVADLARDYDDDDQILVIHASQILYEPLLALVDGLARQQADVALLAQSNHAPAGLMLARCECLRQISSVGFVDLYEQALPAIARHWDVRVGHWPRITGGLVRTPAQYLGSLGTYHRQHLRDRITHHDQTQGGFAVVESGAAVNTTALLHDAVVMNGARVHESAAVVRSIVCPGAVVQAHDSIVDKVVHECGENLDMHTSTDSPHPGIT